MSITSYLSVSRHDYPGFYMELRVQSIHSNVYCTRHYNLGEGQTQKIDVPTGYSIKHNVTSPIRNVNYYLLSFYLDTQKRAYLRSLIIKAVLTGQENSSLDLLIDNKTSINIITGFIYDIDDTIRNTNSDSLCTKNAVRSIDPIQDMLSKTGDALKLLCKVETDNSKKLPLIYLDE